MTELSCRDILVVDLELCSERPPSRGCVVFEDLPRHSHDKGVIVRGERWPVAECMSGLACRVQHTSGRAGTAAPASTTTTPESFNPKTPNMHSHHASETIAVHDALTEAAATCPEIANPHNRFDVSDSALRAAMRFIPDEHHARDFSIGDRFVASVISNARAAQRSPYTVALFALDVA